jgi:hypothetical protein
MILPRGGTVILGAYSGGTRGRYTAVRMLDFTPVGEIVLRGTSGKQHLESFPGAMRHRKRRWTRAGYAIDIREQHAPLVLPDFVPVET